MIDFDFQIKTKLFFGKKKEEQIGEILQTYNAKKILILIGQGSVKKSGLFDLVLNKLTERNIGFLLFEGVRPNPSIDFVRERIDEVRKYQPDFILAVGGGSVIDTAKSFAVSYYFAGDPFDFNLHKTTPIQSLPLGVILTISASGSEMSTSCVMQDDATKVKSGFNSELVRPVFAIENPELTYSVSQTQTAYGVVDIMMHTLERYFQPSSEIEPCDRFAEGLLISVMDAAKRVMNNSRDYEGRANLMLLSSLSHNGLTNIGKKPMMPVHQLEHALSGLYPEVAHAAGLSVLFPAWADYYMNYDLDKFDLLARNVFHLYDKDKCKNAKNGIECIRCFFKSMNMPLTFEDLHLQNVNVKELVDKVTNNGTRVIGHHVKPMDQEVAASIYSSCF